MVDAIAVMNPARETSVGHKRWMEVTVDGVSSIQRSGFSSF